MKNTDSKRSNLSLEQMARSLTEARNRLNSSNTRHSAVLCSTAIAGLIRLPPIEQNPLAHSVMGLIVVESKDLEDDEAYFVTSRVEAVRLVRLIRFCKPLNLDWLYIVNAKEWTRGT